MRDRRRSHSQRRPALPSQAAAGAAAPLTSLQTPELTVLFRPSSSDPVGPDDDGGGSVCDQRRSQSQRHSEFPSHAAPCAAAPTTSLKPPAVALPFRPELSRDEATPGMVVAPPEDATGPLPPPLRASRALCCAAAPLRLTARRSPVQAEPARHNDTATVKTKCHGHGKKKRCGELFCA